MRTSLRLVPTAGASRSWSTSAHWSRPLRTKPPPPDAQPPRLSASPGCIGPQSRGRVRVRTGLPPVFTGTGTSKLMLLTPPRLHLKLRRVEQLLFLSRLHIYEPQLPGMLLERPLNLFQQGNKHRIRAGMIEIQHARLRRKHEMCEVQAARLHPPRSLRRPLVHLDIPLRNLVQLARNSRPITRRKGRSEAISRARPLPDPKSMKVKSSNGISRFARHAENRSGSIGV